MGERLLKGEKTSVAEKEELLPSTVTGKLLLTTMLIVKLLRE